MEGERERQRQRQRIEYSLERSKQRSLGSESHRLDETKEKFIVVTGFPLIFLQLCVRDNK